VQKDLYYEHGTTLSGLMAKHDVKLRHVRNGGKIDVMHEIHEGVRLDAYRIRGNYRERAGRLVTTGAMSVVSPDSLFDVQVKRLHEYKRQL